MSKIISMSLYGNKHWYCGGAIENAKLVPIIYPGWQLRVYYDKSVPDETIRELLFHGAEVFLNPLSAPGMADIPGRGDKGHCGMFWRLQVAHDRSVERWIIRDADSRIGERDADAVAEWTESGLPFHVMHDYPGHHMPIMGGSWGGSGRWLDGVDFSSAGRAGRYHEEEEFIGDNVWPIISDKCLRHDSRPGAVHTDRIRPFRVDGPFVSSHVGRRDLYG